MSRASTVPTTDMFKKRRNAQTKRNDAQRKRNIVQRSQIGVQRKKDVVQSNWNVNLRISRLSLPKAKVRLPAM